MNTSRVPLTGHPRTIALRHLRRTAHQYAAGASSVLAPLGARPRPLAGLDHFSLSAAPRQAPDLLIALPCFGASPCVCLCCPVTRGTTLTCTRQSPQGDHQWTPRRPPARCLPAPCAPQCREPRRTARCSVRNTAWLIPSAKLRCSRTNRVLLVPCAGDLTCLPRIMAIQPPFDAAGIHGGDGRASQDGRWPNHRLASFSTFATPIVPHHCSGQG